MLKLAISKTIQRRGAEQYLENYFRGDASSWAEEDFEKSCMETAVSSGYWLCSAKYLSRAVRAKGFSWSYLRYAERLIEANAIRLFVRGNQKKTVRHSKVVDSEIRAKVVQGTNPVISVVMSVWNGQRYLAEAVESILGQTFSDFEFIIIDDGSTDNSLKILEHYAARDRRIRLLPRENRGLVCSLNEGIAISRGELIARMDADDVSLPNRFAEQVSFLRANEDCVIVGTEVLMIDPDGDPLAIRGHQFDSDLIDRECLLGHGNALTHPSVMIRKSILKEVGFYDPDMVAVEDLDLYLRLCERGKAHNLQVVLLHYRQHPQSVNRLCHKQWEAGKQLAIQRTIQRRGVDVYLRGLFCGVEVAYLRRQSYVEWCMQSAISGGQFRTALKQLRRSVCEKGVRLNDVRKFLFMCFIAVKQKARSALLQASNKHLHGSHTAVASQPMDN